jgi:hypothetical protein
VELVRVRGARVAVPMNLFLCHESQVWAERGGLQKRERERGLSVS